jgi:hypothetical protein
LEYQHFHSGVSWFQAKFDIIRDAVRAYLIRPLYILPNTVTA